MKKVLIVDDAAFMRIAPKSILEKNGFEIIAEAENGVVGVRRYMEYHPDLIMTHMQRLLLSPHQARNRS